MFLRLPVQTSRIYKCLLIIFIVLAVSQLRVSAQDINEQRINVSRLDTSKLSKDQFRLSKKTYLDVYGFNDTATALINLYFAKRKGTQITAYSNLGFLAFIRAAGEEESSPLDPNFNPNAKPSYKTWVLPAVGVAGIVALSLIVRSYEWSLENLVKDLYAYEKTGRLSVKLQKKLKQAHFKIPQK